MKIFFSVGEPSGDLHGANLIGELQRQEPGAQCVGYGGPRMAAAGCELHEDLTQFAIMWFAAAIANIRYFWKLVRRARAYFRDERPDAVVLIDYPGFNWWIARQAKREGIPVFYYGAPQMWAWAAWRIHKMRRLVDHVLCKLPFEADWYRERGCNARYVGHPYFDELRAQQLDKQFVADLQDRLAGRPLVSILPGSRTQEVKTNLKWFLKAAQRIAKVAPETRFAIASFNEAQASIAQEIAAAADVDVEIHVRKTGELIRQARCCMACSGSVSLELTFHATPAVIHYWVDPWFYPIAYRLMKAKYITLANLLADEDRFRRPSYAYRLDDPVYAAAVFPEYPTCTDKSAEMAQHCLSWLEDAEQWRADSDRLSKLCSRLGSAGASETAATYILDVMNSGKDGECGVRHAA